MDNEVKVKIEKVKTDKIKIDFKKQGRLNRKNGKIFENQVRKDLESNGWTVCKWANNIKDDKLEAVKPKFNPFTKQMMMNSGGLPDFVAFKKAPWMPRAYEVWGVEAKKGKYLSAEEKQKIEWYKQHETFNSIWRAYEDAEGKIVYEKL